MPRKRIPDENYSLLGRLGFWLSQRKLSASLDLQASHPRISAVGMGLDRESMWRGPRLRASLIPTADEAHQTPPQASPKWAPGGPPGSFVQEATRVFRGLAVAALSADRAAFFSFVRGRRQNPRWPAAISLAPGWSDEYRPGPSFWSSPLLRARLAVSAI